MTKEEFNNFTTEMVFIDKNGFFSIPTGIQNDSIHYFFKGFDDEKKQYKRIDSVCNFKDANLINAKNMMSLIPNKIKQTHRFHF